LPETQFPEKRLKLLAEVNDKGAKKKNFFNCLNQKSFEKFN
jgi:hypothetical protein